MDGWNALQNWAIFIPLGGLAAYYYWPRDNKTNSTTRVRSQPTTSATSSTKSSKAPASKSPKKTAAGPAKEKPAVKATSKKDGEAHRTEREVPIVQDEPSEDSADRDAKEFARRLTQARQGVDVRKVETKGNRVKTVKQSNAQFGDNDEAFAPSREAVREAGSVADMVEPVPAGPTTLRITPSEKPVKSKSQDKSKKDTKDAKQSKKARQNERKKEAEREQREEDERQRKILEEKQRRTAREARGEPARNGVAPAKAPTDSAWASKSAAAAAPAEATTNQAVLLDTFDAESTSSSNLGGSTAATSTTDGAPSHGTEDVQAAFSNTNHAVDETFDDGAWTTAGSKKGKKGKKAITTSSGDVTPIASTKAAPAPVSSTTAANSRPVGFHALVDEYQQRTDVDANDASNWDA